MSSGPREQRQSQTNEQSDRRLRNDLDLDEGVVHSPTAAFRQDEAILLPGFESDRHPRHADRMRLEYEACVHIALVDVGAIDSEIEGDRIGVGDGRKYDAFEEFHCGVRIVVFYGFRTEDPRVGNLGPPGGGAGRALYARNTEERQAEKAFRIECPLDRQTVLKRDQRIVVSVDERSK